MAAVCLSALPHPATLLSKSFNFDYLIDLILSGQHRGIFTWWEPLFGYHEPEGYQIWKEWSYQSPDKLLKTGKLANKQLKKQVGRNNAFIKSCHGQYLAAFWLIYCAEEEKKKNNSLHEAVLSSYRGVIRHWNTPINIWALEFFDLLTKWEKNNLLQEAADLLSYRRKSY